MPIKKTICCVLNVLRRRSLKRRWMPFLRQDAETIYTQQLEQLRSLLIHAAKHVPYYRNIFNQCSFRPEKMTDLAELQKIPILTKEIVRREGSRMLAENFAMSELQEKSTGGSTGEPLVFYRHKEYLAAAMMGTYRNMALAGWQPGNPLANFWGINDPAHFHIRAFKEELNLGFYTFNAFDAGPQRFVEWLERLDALKPVALYGYASSIELFCRWLDSSGKSRDAFRNLRGVFLTAEKLHAFQRKVIESVLKVPVFNLYGSTEIQNIAFECIKGSMHVASDFVVVEKDSSSSGRGPLLLTSLRNFAMPFIRYRNGDEGELLDRTCDCGINTPCLSIDISRSCDNFKTNSGRIIHGEFFTHVMEGIRGLKMFQFRQVSLDKVILSVVADENVDEKTRKTVEGIPSVIGQKTDHGFKVDVQWVENIPLTSRGKHIFTISNLKS